MSGLQISKGTDDIQKFGELIPLIPKFCRYLSACAFKKALLLVSPLNCGVRADLSVDDNSRSPFIVLALVENMFAEFTFVDIEMKRPTESLSHLYAQALVDLELLRQYFVLQIRTASLMGRKKGAKLTLMQDAVQHVRKLCILISMRIAVIGAYVQMKSSSECGVDFECRGALLRSCNAALALLEDGSLPDSMLKLFQRAFLEILCLILLNDCVFFIDKGKYSESVLTLSQCKYYISKYSQLMTGVAGVKSQSASIADLCEPREITWLRRLCLHRQETLSIVFTMQRLGPVRSTCHDMADALSSGKGFDAGLPKLNAFIKEHCVDGTSVLKEENLANAANYVEHCVVTLMSSVREHYGRVALLLVRRTDESCDQSGTLSHDSAQHSGRHMVSVSPTETFRSSHGSIFGNRPHAWSRAVNSPVEDGRGLSSKVCLFDRSIKNNSHIGAKFAQDAMATDDVRSKLPCKLLSPAPLGFGQEPSEAAIGLKARSLHPVTIESVISNGGEAPKKSVRSGSVSLMKPGAAQCDASLMAGGWTVLRIESSSYMQLTDGPSSGKAYVPLSSLLSQFGLSDVPFIGANLKQLICMPATSPNIEKQDTYDWLQSHAAAIAEAISNNEFPPNIHCSTVEKVNTFRLPPHQCNTSLLTSSILGDKLQDREVRTNLDQSGTSRSPGEGNSKILIENSKHIILNEGLLSPAAQACSTSLWHSYGIDDGGAASEYDNIYRDEPLGSFQWVLICDEVTCDSLKTMQRSAPHDVEDKIRTAFKLFVASLRGNAISEMLL